MTRRGVLGWLASGASVVLPGCGFREAALRYQVMLDVDTPTGRKSGSSVLQTTLSAAPSWLGPEAGGGRTTFGEAPSVHISGGRRLFALLHGINWQQPMSDTLLRLLADGDLRPPLSKQYEYGDWQDSFAEARRTLPTGIVRRAYPMLVSFADAAVPTSVFELDPEDISAALGAGYRLAALTLQVVPDATPLTTGIDRFLPWLGTHSDARLSTASGPMSRAPLPSKLNNGSFRVVRAS